MCKNQPSIYALKAKMSKLKTAYVCSSCGETAPKWAGQCSACKEWNTLTEYKIPAKDQSTSKREGYAGKAGGSAEKLSSVDTTQKTSRYPCGIGELDRVLGGGFVEGAVVLIGGDPGIGKSTLLLQATSRLSATLPALYVSGEESLEQIAMRSNRLGLNVDGIDALCAVELEHIIETLHLKQPKVAVIDSIQTLYSSNLDSAPGTVSQVRECAAALTRYAKTKGCVIVLVGHVTKDGTLAGPRVLEHIVDAVLYFEGDPQMSYRIIRAFKNRFGGIHEIGVFSMSEDGLSEVSNPSALFLQPHKGPVNGACVCAIAEGTRPLLVEVQALVEDTPAPNPRRLCVGLDPNRLAMILAVLQKSAGMDTHAQNVFLNITGGARIGETGADLCALLAITSSIRNKALPNGLLAFGEVGLTGEVRLVQKGTERIVEAAKLGFSKALIPSGNLPKIKIPGIEICPVDTVAEALVAIREWETGNTPSQSLSKTLR